MTRFYPVYCRRSDGKVEALVKGKRKELNQPTDEQLDQKPDKNGISDFYREVAPDEAKSLDWRRKLGGMLAREMGWKDKNAQLGSENGYMLITFPENYRLYEHVKKTEKDGKTEVKSKTHAAGGNERQDAYLYGHPEGRRKRYRSPADFFPHLLWLATDETGDHENCSCKICSPDDLDDPASTKTKIKADPGLVIQTPLETARQTSGQGVPTPKQEPLPPTLLQRPPNSPQALMPSPLPPAKSADQHYDMQYNVFMYRPGELVWFSRGQAWGLASILRRWLTPSGQYNYIVQPLSHPYGHPAPVTKTSNNELRPWLAWSVPRYTYDGLNNMPEPFKYESADWQGMKHGRYGPGDLEVDGSILAAKSVDSSYTPLMPRQTAEIAAGATETQYEAVFLGAEKIWLGDPIRLGPGPNTDILVVHGIIERSRKIPSDPTSKPTTQLHFLGDIYKLQIITHNNPALPSPALPNNNPHLPPRLTEDLNFRNTRSIPAKHIASFWKLISAQTRVEADNIKGRWYEASLLLPILQRENFEESARKGEIQEASLWMNARGDCVNANRHTTLPKLQRENVRRETRREAFGAAMPAGTEIREGVEPPLPENVDPSLEGLAGGGSMEIDPKFETADNVAESEGRTGGEHEHEGGSGIDEFMDLTNMDDSQMPGFGKEYGSQGENAHGFF